MALVTNNAEGGTDGTTVTIPNSGGGSGTAFSITPAGATFSAAQKAHGSLAYAMSGAASTQNYLSLPSSDGGTSAFAYRFYAYLTGYPSASTSFGVVESSSATIAGLNLTTAGKIQLAISPFSTFTNAIPLNTWVRIEVQGTINASTGTCTISLYTGDSTTATESHTYSSLNTGSAAAVKVYYGKLSGTPSMATYYLDDLAQDLTTSTAIGPVASNAAPTANAGADQTGIEPFATVTLDGSGSSDPDGDTITYAWTQTSGTTVTLSDATAQKPTFTAPATQAGDTLTFSLTVTDSHGAASSADTVNVTVLPHLTWQLGTDAELHPVIIRRPA